MWLHRVLVRALDISSCGMWTLSCSILGLVPWPGMELRTPALRAQSQPLDHQGSPHHHFFQWWELLPVQFYCQDVVLSLRTLQRLLIWPRGKSKSFQWPLRVYNLWPVFSVMSSPVTTPWSTQSQSGRATGTLLPQGFCTWNSSPLRGSQPTSFKSWLLCHLSEVILGHFFLNWAPSPMLPISLPGLVFLLVPVGLLW